jgi:putative glycosyltransferase
MRLSIVATMYRSSRFLREFHERVSKAARDKTADYEIVLVNDGSPDDSLQVALELQAADPRVRIVDLSRNFGHHQAMWTGLQHARGDWMFLIDCDLEEDPAWLHRFMEMRDENGSDVIFGVQDGRRGSRSERWFGKLYYKLFNVLSDTPLPENLLTVRLMSRRYVDALLRHGEVTLHIAGLWARTGFLQTPCVVRKEQRRQTTYSFTRRARMFVNTLTSSTSLPLVFIFYFGVGLLTLAGLVGAGLIVERLLIPDVPLGWPSLMVSLWFLGGLNIFCQGILGIYLAKIYLEAKHRPVSIVRHVYDVGAGAAAGSNCLPTRLSA